MKRQASNVCVMFAVSMIIGIAVPGCSDPPLPPPISVRGEVDTYHIPIMLDGKTLSHSGIRWTCELAGISNVVINGTTEVESGKYISDVSFRSGNGNSNVDARVSVTYQIHKASIQGGGEISLFPVSNITSLSLKHVSGDAGELATAQTITSGEVN